MKLSNYLFIASLGIQISNVSGLIAKPIRLYAASQNNIRGLNARVVIALKPAPKPIVEDPSAPKEGVNHGSPGSITGNSGSGGTETSHRSTRGALLLRLEEDSDPGYGQVLSPDAYIARGRAVLEQSRAAFIANPRVDKPYDDWSRRYQRTFDSTAIEGDAESGTNTIEDFEETGAALEEILNGIEVQGNKQWSERGCASLNQPPVNAGRRP